MNAAKAEQLLSNQTHTARKVYEATPTQEPWSVHQIRSEVLRLHGTAPDINITEGALNTLINSGLVKEQGRRMYVRSAVRARAVVVKAPAPGSDTGKPVLGVVEQSQSIDAAVVGDVGRNQEAANTLSAVVENPRGVEPIVAIDLLSREVRSIAQDFHALAQMAQAAQARLARISEALDDVALGVTESMEKSKGEVEQLRQLRALLKNIA